MSLVDVGDLFDLLQRPAWQRDAACLEHPEVNYFPERGGSLEPAKAVCAGCLVRAECCAYAVEQGVEHGVWGGTSPQARRALRPAQAAA